MKRFVTSSHEIVVVTPYGRLRGLEDGQGAAFRGIRYAEPPVDARRFLPPAARRRATGETDARAPGAASCQIVMPEPAWSTQAAPVVTDEDCLNLNVFTPGADDVRRPVLVHVFGGGFQAGHANSPLQDGAALAVQGDVVVVRVNFRVGALGFVHLGPVWGEPYSAGNVALLDVCVALEWVRENIAGLGGDPGNVTLFGLSSGAFMIAALFGVAASRGLFHRAWMQSGSASRVIPASVAIGQARDFLDVLGIEAGDRVALQSVPAARILEAQSRICAVDLGERNAPGGRTLGIVADGVTLAEHPLAVLSRGDRRDVPIVVGSTRDEARLWFARGLMTPSKSLGNFEQEVARFVGPVRATGLLAAYRLACPELGLDGLRERFLTDAIYRLPSLCTAAAQAASGGQAHAYRFDWCSPALGGQLGASHGFDEAFVWNATARAPYAAGDSVAPVVAELMSSALLRFAHSGTPGWPVWNEARPCTHLFGATGRGAAGDDAWLRTTWDGIERP